MEETPHFLSRELASLLLATGIAFGNEGSGGSGGGGTLAARFGLANAASRAAGTTDPLRPDGAGGAGASRACVRSSRCQHALATMEAEARNAHGVNPKEQLKNRSGRWG